MNDQRKTRTELLCPAGQWDSMRAAVANGADAVYFGLSDFSARKRATNFGLDELPAVMDFLRGHNVRGYVAFNTLIFSEELAAAAKFVEAIAAAGVDAAIVQDFGLARMIQQMAPTLAIHASTQMTQTDAEGITLLKELGVSRVILARELSVAQIREIAAATDMELEVFVHGALCMSYSGQCLASESLFGRSANRGLCAQACRLPYELRGTRRGGPVSSSGDPTRKEAEETHGRDGHATYLLSPRDLGAWDLVKELVDVPVAAIKIEGRLKSPHYVAAATAIYRQALDEALAGRRFQITDAQMAQLEMSFSRGFTRGFLGGERRSLVDGRFGNRRGQFLGTVVGKAGSGIVIESGVGGVIVVKPGDGLVFDDGHEQERPPGGRVYRARPLPAQGVEGLPRVEILFGRDDLDPGRVTIGSAAWKTDDPALRAELEKTWARDVIVHRALLHARVRAAVGEPLRLEMWESGLAVSAMRPTGVSPVGGAPGATASPLAAVSSDIAKSSVIGQPVRPATCTGDAHATSIYASVQSGQPMEASRQHPLTVDLLRKQLGRLGGTPFELAGIELRDAAGKPCESVPVMAPASVLNDVRRQVVELLLARRKAAAVHAVADGDALQTLRLEAAATVQQAAGEQETGRDVAARPALHVLVRNLGQLEAVLAWRGGAMHEPETSNQDDGSFPSLTLRARDGGGGCEMGMIYCDFDNVGQYERAIEAGRAAGVAVAIAAPRIIKSGEHAVLEAIAKLSPAAVLVRNLAGVGWLRGHYPELPVVCDFSLNAVNELSAKWLAMRGALRVTPGYDLNMQQFAAMRGRCAGVDLEAVIHFHMPMFHTEYCLLSAGASDGMDGGDCGRPCGPLGGLHGPCGRATPAAAGHDCHATSFLRDRMGVEHPILRDCLCRNTIYNAHAQSAAFFVEQIKRLGVRHFRVELLTHTPLEIGPLLDVYSQLIQGKIDGREAWREVQSLNPDGLTRGTWELA